MCEWNDFCLSVRRSESAMSGGRKFMYTVFRNLQIFGRQNTTYYILLVNGLTL